jgi:hypothetical protein
MTKPTRVEVNCTTGETSIIELTDAEIADMQAAQAQAELDRAADEALKAQAQADKEAIAAKLGLTSEELAKLFA